MFLTEALTNKPLHIGRHDTNETLGILFDVSDVRKAVPGATFTLMFAPHGTPKEEAYPIPLTDYDEDHVLWLVTAADTAVLGTANAQVFAVSGEKRWKSQFYTVLVEKSLGTAGEAPSPIQPYINVILEARDGAVEAKTSAETARDEAVTAKTEAQTLAQSALTSAINAHASEQLAMSHLNSAITAAASARTSATEARQHAEEAKQDYTSLNTKVDGMYTNEQIDEKIQDVEYVKPLFVTELPAADSGNYGRFAIAMGETDRLFINLKNYGSYNWFEFKQGETPSGNSAILGSAIVGTLVLGKE